jgi:hypothetical protein
VTLRLGQDWNRGSPTADDTGVTAQTDGAAPIALVLGFGNILLSDDGAGVKLIERLRTELGADAATFVDGGT